MTVFHSGVGLCTAMALLCGVSRLATAQTMIGAESRPSDNSSIALNRAVALEADATSIGPVAEPAPDVGDAAEPAVFPAPGSDQARERRAARRQTTEFAFPRNDIRVSHSATAPWYRTGLGALAIVLGVLGALTWAMRRWLPLARTGDGRILRVVARSALSHRHSLVLVQLGRRLVMVGLAPDRLSVLCEINDPQEAAELGLGTPTANREEAGEFDALLRSEHSAYRDLQSTGPPGLSPPSRDARRGRQPLRTLLSRLRSAQAT